VGDTTPVAEALPAATILLVRDGPDGLEVFMVERHHEIDFATGALVFPGGKVDPQDSDPSLLERCVGPETAGDQELVLRAAAIRETFEECGVLLARRREAPHLLTRSEVEPLAAERAALLRGEPTFPALAAREDLLLACDRLIPFAHWITPERMPKRFDTHFFLTAAPPDQAAIHDGEESVDSVWIDPGAAAAEANGGRRTIIFPTLRNLAKLARSRSVAEAVERALVEPIVTVLPWIEKGGDGPVLRIPKDAGYDISEIPFRPPKPPNR